MKTRPRIVELDFGMGNIRSLQKSFEYLGAQVDVIRDPESIKNADALVLPGDGAFGKAMDNIHKTGFFGAIREFVKTGKPLLGVCIGFQVLFDSSEEFEYSGSGFSYFNGRVEKFRSPNLTIPHMGWNQISWNNESKLRKGIADGSYFYFVHSYRVAGIHEGSAALCDYDGQFTAVVEKENIFGVQFHPEKSYKAGLKLLKNFIELI